MNSINESASKQAEYDKNIHKEINRLKDLEMQKKASKISIGESEGSNADYGIYDREIEETNELINQISEQVQNLGVTFEEIKQSRKQVDDKTYEEEKKGTEVIKKALTNKWASFAKRLIEHSNHKKAILAMKYRSESDDDLTPSPKSKIKNKPALNHELKVLKEVECQKYENVCHEDTRCELCN